jgi:predicted RNA-binding Zn ribbon-like protein
MNHRPPALFIADAPALDFLNSIATPVDTPVEWIDSGDGLLAWLRQADLVPDEVLARLRRQALPGELDAVAAQARTLREWFRGFVRTHRGRPLEAKHLKELDPLNRLLERDEVFSQVVAPRDGAAAAFEYRRTRRWRSPESLLLPIGEMLARFVCEEDFAQVRACEGATCTLMFADHTRSHSRRWCSMSVCGNRAKVAAHRSRAKNAAA